MVSPTQNDKQGIAQLELPLDTPEIKSVMNAVSGILHSWAQPSAWELIKGLEREFGLKVRWVVDDALRRLIDDSSVTKMERDYLQRAGQPDAIRQK